MFAQLLRFEWRYHIRHISFPAFGLFFFAFGFFLSGKVFGGDHLYNNAPYNITKSLGLLSLAAIFCMMVLAIRVLLRDQQSGMQELIFSTPIKKRPFLLSRFCGYLTISLFLFAFTLLGLWLGAMSTPPGKDLGPIHWSHYIWPFLTLAVPNIILGGVVLFTIANLTKNTMATYIGGILLYCLYWIAAMLLNSPMMAGSTPASAEGMALAALLDPFGLSAFFEQTQYWELQKKNTQLIALHGHFLYNRLLWLIISGGLFLLNYLAFKFRKGKGSAYRNKAVLEVVPTVEGGFKEKTGPFMATHFSNADHFKILWNNFRLELWQILRSWPFWLLLFLWTGIVASEILTRICGGGEYGTALYPTTNLMIWLYADPFRFLAVLLVIFYAGEIVHRERSLKMNEFKDSLPVGNWAFFISKYMALVSIPVLLILNAILIAVVCQVSKGWYLLEWPQYLSSFYVNGLSVFFFAVMAVFIQNLVSNKYLGMLLSLLLALLFTTQIGAKIGINHPLLKIGTLPSLDYNNMNGYGPQWTAFHWMALYWGIFHGLIAWLTYRLWRRGTEFRLLKSIQKCGLNLSGKSKVLILFFLVAFLTMGVFVYYNTNVLNDYRLREEILDQKADYEKQYKPFEDLPGLSLVEVKTKVDLYPQKRQYFIAHDLVLENKTTAPISELFFTVSPFVKVNRFEIRDAILRKQDTEHGVYWFDLNTPLAPGETTLMEFDIEDNHQGFQVGTSFLGMDIVENGTNIMSRFITPSFGYRQSNEIIDNEERKKRGLSPIEEEQEDPLHSDASANYKFNFETIISTDADQIALAPGRLLAQKLENGRQIFHYKTDHPINNFYSYLSAKYEVKKQAHNGIDLSVYYASGHDYNVDLMMQTMQHTLDYCQQSFSPYEMQHLRIAEIPGHWPMGGYATPGLIGLVEDRAFFTDLRDSTSFDVVTKRVAHEVAHQWFGHQLNPQSGPGASMLVESFAKYMEVVMLDQQHGKGQLRQLLKDQMHDYFSKRNQTGQVEPPLDHVENEAYIYYAKGGIVMNALRDLLGEDILNAAIEEMIDGYGYPKPRGTASDFIRILKSCSPIQTHAQIDDWVSKVVFFDNKITAVKYRYLPNGLCEITVDIEAAKKLKNGDNQLIDTSFSELMNIGFFDQHPDQITRSDAPLYLEKHLIKNGENQMVITLDKLPKYVVLDPYLNLLDKNVYDNVLRIDELR